MTQLDANGHDVHPRPWRGICKFCNTVLEQSGPDDWWLTPGLAGFGGGEECQKAPRMESGDPGHHVPRLALSRNGTVPAAEVRAAAHWSIEALIE